MGLAEEIRTEYLICVMAGLYFRIRLRCIPYKSMYNESGVYRSVRLQDERRSTCSQAHFNTACIGRFKFG